MALFTYTPSRYSMCRSTYETKGESYLDAETSCDKCADDYQQCRQSYYAKQQLEVSKKSNNNQIQCDYTKYQREIDDLNVANVKLTSENEYLQSRLATSTNQQYSGIDTPQFLGGLITYQGLSILLGIMVVVLGYMLYRGKIRPK